MLWRLLILTLSLATSVDAAPVCTTYHDVDPSFLSHKMDGDTIAIKHLGPMLLKFRVKEIDTAERSDPLRWLEAREYTWTWLHRGPFTIYTCWKPTLDRHEAVISRGDMTLADALRAQGLQK